jgi:hypothetical protein
MKLRQADNQGVAQFISTTIYVIPSKIWRSLHFRRTSGGGVCGNYLVSKTKFLMIYVDCVEVY